MKKYTPYILGGLLLAVVAVMLFTGDNSSPERRVFNERITLRSKDKIPYGTYVAFNELKQLFPQAEITTDKMAPGRWKELSAARSGQALVILTRRFTPDEDEMRKLIAFAEAGNDVFVSAMYISTAADNMLRCNSSSYGYYNIGTDELRKKMMVYLVNPYTGNREKFRYPGHTFNSYFTKTDDATTDILGLNSDEKPDFIHLKAGSGNFFVHLEPLAFSNYFLLYRKNIRYYEKVFSFIHPDTRKLVWDEYYNSDLSNRPPQKKEGMMKVLFRYKAFRAALLTAMAALLLYVLMEMRRKRRMIPVVKKPANDSLDFVRTIGRLYYEKGDHRNLCIKMSSYFLEHVRNKYKLPTSNLDEQFVNNLHYKSGVDRALVHQLVSFIGYLEQGNKVTAAQLTEYHKKLEAYYKNE